MALAAVRSKVVALLLLTFVTLIVGVCNCSKFCCTLLYVHSSFAIILIGKRELVVLLNLSSRCIVMVVRLFLTVPWVCLRFVIVGFPDHTHLLLFGVNACCIIKRTTIGNIQNIKPFFSGHSERRPKIGFQDPLALNAGQKYFHKATICHLDLCFVYFWVAA